MSYPGGSIYPGSGLYPGMGSGALPRIDLDTRLIIDPRGSSMSVDPSRSEMRIRSGRSIVVLDTDQEP